MLRGKIDPKKEEQDRLQGFLLEMLKEEENKYCADCQAKTPRWAAWNLGIFICIRCAGIHRNLGVHISKVRSVNLDSWTPEQVQTMRVMGNEKAREVYEHELPPQFRRPTSDAQMEQFIRSKYEQKRYILRGFVYPRVDVAELPKSFANMGSKKTNHPVVSISTKTNFSPNESAPPVQSCGVSDLLDFSSPPSASDNSNKTGSGNIMDDFAGLSIQQPAAAACNQPSDDFDDFGSFVSASGTAPTAVASTGFADFSAPPSVSTPVESSNLADLSFPVTSSNQNGGAQKKSNADIMSLFGGSSSATSTSATAQPVLVAPGGFTAFGLQAAQPTSNSFAAFENVAPNQQSEMFGGLGGINFGSSAPPTMPNLQFSGQSIGMTKQTPSSPNSQSASGFSIPNKSNAFADLALGKVMKTTYGQNALQVNPSSSATRTSPIMANPVVPSMTTTASNDLFDMFASAPPSQVPVTVNAPASMGNGLDDLLGL